MRKTSVERVTKETNIKIDFCVEGNGNSSIDTGIGFFDHMLSSFSKHGNFDIYIKAIGDLCVDCHHTIEDVGIVLGQAIKNVLEDKKGILRFGSSIVPMDEALAMCAVDVSGRSYLVFNGNFPQEKVGELDTCMIKEFFVALSNNAGITVHIKQLDGDNSHHIIEAMFKAFARALKEALTIDANNNSVLSTKGVL